MDPSEDTAVQDFLEILEEHRKNCERQGKYVEAEIAKNRLDELKLHEENRRRVRMNDLRSNMMHIVVTHDYCACRRRCDRGKSLSVWAWKRHICWSFSSST